MKRIFPLVLPLIVLVSCRRSNVEKAHDLVQNYCYNNFFSPEDYTPLSFDSLKIYFKPYRESTEYLRLDSERQRLEINKDSVYALMSESKSKAFYQQKADSLDKTMNSINNLINRDAHSYRVVQQGWEIEHSYSRKDDAGRVVEGHSKFILDNSLSKVLQAVDE